MHLGRPIISTGSALSQHDAFGRSGGADLGFLGDPELSLFSIIFWYVGHPDLATLRDRAEGKVAPDSTARSRSAGAARRGIGTLRDLPHGDGALAVPLVVSLHSVVGLDFAASLMPGWEETIFPPYFVVGAMYSGFAMVVVLAAMVRWGFGMQAIITVDISMSWRRSCSPPPSSWGFLMRPNGSPPGTAARRRPLAGRLHVHRHLCADVPGRCCLQRVMPQAFWFARVRRNVVAVFIIAVFINIGMWLERILIVWNTLSHGFLPSMRRAFLPTIWDWSLLSARSASSRSCS